MIDVIFGAFTYSVALLGCYDGDTCRFDFTTLHPLLGIQSVRISGVDTPEIRGRCVHERELATLARDHTLSYLQDNPVVYTSGRRGKYGRLLVMVPGLADSLVDRGLGRYYNGGKRKGWCDD